MNDVLKTLQNRVSLRGYEKKEITPQDYNAIIESMMRAPTAGNQMLYSVIAVREQKTKEILSRTYCHRPPYPGIFGRPPALVRLLPPKRCSSVLPGKGPAF